MSDCRSLFIACLLLLLWSTAPSTTVAEVVSELESKPLWPPSHKYIQVDEERIESILSSMTLREKVGQLVMAEIRWIRPRDLRRFPLGGILNGGGAFPHNNKQASVADWVSLAEAFHEASVSGRGANIPVIWGTDAVHGHNNVLGATLFPHNIGLGATRNPALLTLIGRATAAEVAATGIFWVFAPTVAVPQDASWGRTYEGYSEDPLLVAELGSALIRGLQGRWHSGALADDRVIATAKHFIGDGGTYQGIDQGDTVAEEATLRYLHGPGYVTALQAGTQTVMASYNSWNGQKVHGYRYLLTEVLKNRMGFDGLVVGDWNGHEQLPGCSEADCAQAINAGIDMIMVPEAWRRFFSNTLKQARRGVIGEARLDDAVRRVLRVKMRAGLLDGKRPGLRARQGDQKFVGNRQHRALARQAVKESLVLLKNNHSTLPLNPQASVLVVGESARRLQDQMGGWSMTWYGTGNRNSDFPGAVSIWQGIAELVRQQGGSAQYSTDGSFTEKPSAALVVFGESPYAEGAGDREHLAFSPEDRMHLRAMKALRALGIPVVAIFLSGRPMWVNPELNAADAFVAAWLPGSEAGAMAEVLFCSREQDPDCDFSGKLSFSWPSSRLNLSRQGDQALFPFGYGLTYADTRNLPQYRETPEP